VAEDGAEEFTGRTVADAIEEAESTFRLSRDDLRIEVLTTGSRGVFGIGAEPARIRVTRRAQPTVVPGEPPPVPAGPPDENENNGASYGPSSVASAGPDEEVRGAGVGLAQEASETLSDLLKTMGFRAEVEVRREADPVTLAVNGENLGVLIGRRGDNLAALQFMVNLILSKNRRQWPRVIIDVENYRARREESLRALADRIAFRVRRSQRAFTLEAMPASDRRIIHLTLRDRSDVETYSIGEGPARRVVVAPTRGQQSASPETRYS